MDLSTLRHHLVRDLKLKTDDIVFLFSSLQGLGRVGLKPQGIIQVFKEVLSAGAFILPTFTQNCIAHGASTAVEVRRNMGALPFLSLIDEEFERTLHPHFSVNVWSKNTTLIDSISPTTSSAFGLGSTLFNLYNFFPETKVILLGDVFPEVSYRSTFIHTAQELEDCWYRYQKNRVCAAGTCLTKQYVRYLSKDEYNSLNGEYHTELNFPIVEDFSHYSKDLVACNILRLEKFGMSKTRIVDLGKSIDLFRFRIQINRDYGLDARCISKGD